MFFCLLNRIIFSLKVNFEVSSSKTSFLCSIEMSSISDTLINSVFDSCFSSLYVFVDIVGIVSFDKEEELEKISLLFLEETRRTL